MKVIKGVAVCNGIAIGNVFYHEKTVLDIPDTLSTNPDAEWKQCSDAISQADKHLEKLYHQTLETIGSAEAEIFDMHRLMLADEDFCDAIKAKIYDEGLNVLKAIHEAGIEFAALFEQLDDEYMQARAVDVHDVSGLLKEIIAGVPKREKLEVPSVIFAWDLTPSETVQMDKENILGFVTQKGSSTSHTAILARTMGIPSIVQADFLQQDITTDMLVAVDGYEGVCYLAPDDSTLATLKEKQKREAEFKLECEAVRGLPSITKSGKAISVYANIGNNEDISSVLENDAEGIGLFRSEFLYLGRTSPPSEEMQFAAYKNVAEKMNGKKVIIRTMDIGADKQADYLGIQPEENPALGYRAIRICLDRPELFQTQLRAICRASAFGNVSVMFPMICSIWEIRECKKALLAAQESLKKENISYGEMEIGIMIETPAAVILRDEFAKEVDFFSVGTNDLTQYTLAADRQNQRLERYADPHHPAILEMLRLISESAVNNGIWAGICGELAGDFTLTEKFIQMGYGELSVAPPMVLPLRKHIREKS